MGSGNRILVAFALLVFLALLYHIMPVIAAGIDGVYLVSPANGNWTTQDNDTILFTFNYTGDNATAYCILFLNSTGEFLPVNETSANNVTDTGLYSNTSIGEGERGWYVNCTNETESMISSIFTLNVDRTEPAITVNLPPNSTVNSDVFNFTYSENNLNCSWYSVNESSNITNCSITNNEWVGTLSSLSDGQHNITIWANDTAGNENSTLLYWIRDTTGPSFSGYAREPNPPHEDQAVELNATISEIANTVILEVDNGTKTNYTVATNNSLEYYFNLGIGNYTAHNMVNYTWFANDTLGNGNWSAQQSFVVANQIPSVGAFNLNATSPKTNDFLLCENGTFTENDYEDTEQGREYVWYDGDNEIAGETLQTLSLGGAGLDKGDVIKCSERVYDGYAWSAWMNSSNTATIQNTPPTLPTLEYPSNGTMTSDSTPFLNWTVSSDADGDAINYTIEISDDSGFGYLNQSNYTLIFNNYTADVLSDGLYYWRVLASTTDANSSWSEAFNLTIDMTPPDINITSPQNITYNTAVIDLNVSSDGTENGWKYSLNGTVNVSFPPNTTITAAEDENNITVYVNDSLGNENSTIIYFTVDLTDPVPIIAIPANVTYAYDPELNFSYTETRPDSCWYSLNDSGNVTLASCNTNGTILTTGEGGQNVRLCMNDTSGREGCHQIYYTKDTTPPLVSINKPQNSTLNSDDFNFSYNDVNCSWYSVDGGANTTNCSVTGLEWAGVLIISSDGTHKVTVWANDSLGNANSTIRYWTRDTQKPAITIQTPSNTSYDSGDRWLNVTLSESADSCFVNYGFDNISMSNTTSNWNYHNASMNEGPHQTVFYCNDTSGNLNSTSVYFTIDLTNPEPAIIVPSNTTYQANPQLNFSYNESNPGSCKYSLNGAANDTLVSCETNGTILTSNEGGNDVRLCMNDTAGREGCQQVYYTKDTAGPLFSGYAREPDSPNEDQAFEANVTISEITDTVILELNNGSKTNYTITSNYSLEYYFYVATGNYTAHDVINYSWFANDTVGNGNWSALQNFTVANQIPITGAFNLNDTTPATNDHLSCSNGTFTDNDADDTEQSRQYKWYDGDSEVVGETSQTLLLTVPGFDKGDVIKCSERVYDGYAWSNWVNSTNTATIQNTPPTSPTLQLPSNGTKTNDDTPFFNWTLSTDADSDSINYTIQISTDPSFASVDRANYSSIYNYYNSAPLTDNIYYWRVWTVTSDANSSISQVSNITIDTTPPAITLSWPQNITYTNESVWFNATASSDTDTCITQIGRSVSYNDLFNHTMTNSTGNWNYYNASMSINQDESYFMARVYCNDTLGNWNVTDFVYFTIDVNAPLISIEKPQNTTTNSDAFNFSYPIYNFNCSWYSVNDGPNNTNCSIAGIYWWSDLTGLSDGANKIQVWANDTAGNTNSSVRYWTRDTTPPPIYISSPANVTYGTNTIYLNVSSDGTESEWKWWTNGTANVTFTPNTTITKVQDHYNLTVYVNDSAGNWNSTTIYFTIDTTSPVIWILSPYETTYASDPQLNFSYTEDNPDSCWYSLNGTANITLASCDTNGTVLLSGQGQNNVTLCINDTVGRENCDFVNYTKDSNPPIITVYSPVNTTYPASVVFNISINKFGDTCLVDWDGTNRTMEASGSNLWWNLTNSSMPDEAYEAKFFCNDTLGNGNTTSVYFTIDTTPPAIFVTSPQNISYTNESMWFNATSSSDTDTCIAQIGRSLSYMNLYNHTMTNCTGNWNYYNASMSINEDGTYFRVKVYCKDISGNWNSTDYVYFFIDTVPPNISIEAPSNISTWNDSFHFTYSGVNVNCSWYSLDDNTNVTNCSLYNGGVVNDVPFYLWAGVFTGLSDGQHNVTMWANDMVGNTNSSVRYWTRDTDAPAVHIYLPQNTTYNTTNISLNVSSDETINTWIYKLNAGSNTTFTPNTTVATQYGSNTIVIYANDVADNVNASSVTFFVNYTSPVLQFPGHYPTTGDGWSDNHSFTVSCGDADGDNATLYLWSRITPTSAWTLIGQQNCTDTIPSSHVFNISTFTCSDVTPSGTNSQFKFNATDIHDLSAETAPQNFTLEENNATVSITAGSNRTSILNDTATLFFRVYDSTRGNYYSDTAGVIWVTENSATYTRILNCTTNSTGHCVVSYNPNASASTIGTQYWKAGTNATCYQPTNSSNQTLEVTNPISSVAISPRSVLNGSSVYLYASHSANFIYLWANVTLPDATHQIVALTNGTNTTFSSTSLVGRYDVTFFANDSLGEAIVNETSYFDTLPQVTFNISIINYNSSGVNSSVTIYYGGGNVSSNSSANGTCVQNVIDAIVDVEIKCYQDRFMVMLRGINASAETNEFFGVDKHASTSGYLVTYDINNSFNITNATLTIYYDDLSFANEDNLKLHRCASYNFTARTCAGSWEDMSANATQNKTGNYFALNVTSFSGFSLKEETTSTTPPSGSSTGPSFPSVCSINWSCGNWDVCNSSNLQIRKCIDKGTCKKADVVETVACTYIPTCFDGKLNGDESDVDCGGSCGACTFASKCAENGDCESGYCESGTCKTPAQAKPPEKQVTEMPTKPIVMTDIILCVAFTILLVVFVMIIISLSKLGKAEVKNQNPTI